MSSKRDSKRRRRRSAPGAPPGTINVPPNSQPSKIRMLRYGDGVLEDRELSVKEPLPKPQDNSVLWLDISGFGSVSLFLELERVYGLHNLTLEDILSAHQRPKAETFDNYEFIVVHVPEVEGQLRLQQLSLVLGNGFVLTLSEQQAEPMAPVRQRIVGRAGLIAHAGADYLAYAVLDAVTDYFFPVLDSIAEKLDDIERTVLSDLTVTILPQLYEIKEELRDCRRSVWPLRDLLYALGRDDHPLIQRETRLHLRDCQDHVNQLLESIESDRDTATALMELHVSAVGNRMNEVMKVLTIIATIFIPLSFITGLYGMNFDRQVSAWNMPELGWAYGYPAVLVLMLVIAAGLLVFFRRRGWVGPTGTAPLVPDSDETQD